MDSTYFHHFRSKHFYIFDVCRTFLALCGCHFPFFWLNVSYCHAHALCMLKMRHAIFKNLNNRFFPPLLRTGSPKMWQHNVKHLPSHLLPLWGRELPFWQGWHFMVQWHYCNVKKKKTASTFCEWSKGTVERWRQRESQMLSKVFNTPFKALNVTGRNVGGQMMMNMLLFRRLNICHVTNHEKQIYHCQQQCSSLTVIVTFIVMLNLSKIQVLLHLLRTHSLLHWQNVTKSKKKLYKFWKYSHIQHLFHRRERSLF